MAIDIAAFQSAEILVPLAFSLAIIFGILEITRIFRNKAVNFIVAFTLSIFAVINSAFVSFLWANLVFVAAFFIIMFFIIFVYKVFGSGRKNVDAIIMNGAILFVLLSLSYLYINSFPSVPFIGGGENLILLIAIVLILSIFWAVFKTGSEPQPQGR